MDYATAIPISVTIVMAGTAVLTLIKKRNFKNPDSGGFVPRKELNEKFKEIVFKDACDPAMKGVSKEIRLTKEALEGKMDSLKDTMQTGFADIKRELEKRH